MATHAELQGQVDHLTAILSERDRKDAEARAAALVAQQATADAKSAVERADAAKAERELVRRGSFVNFLLTQLPPDQPVDFAAIDAAIPKDESAWPPGVNPADFVLTGGARIRSENKVEVAETTLGRMLAAMTPKLN